jgi:hypothetical protein
MREFCFVPLFVKLFHHAGRLCAMALLAVFCLGLTAAAQEKEAPAAPAKPQDAKPPPDGNYTAEQVAELFIFANGSRAIIQQIRRSGVEHGRVTRTNADGRSEEVNYDLRFLRGENLEKDKLRLDQQMPTIEYSLIYSGGKVFGLLKGSVFAPRPEAATEFLHPLVRGLEALLRYKENGSTVALVGKEKQQNVDLYVLDLTDKEQRRTRFFISAKYFRVLWVEYEETGVDGVKSTFKRRFYDYRFAQSTLVPFRSVLYRDGKQISEQQVLTVTYGGKIDDAIFQNPEIGNR